MIKNEQKEFELRELVYDKVMRYTNEKVIYGFMRDFDIPEDEVIDIFNETKKYLYLCGVPSNDENRKSLAIHEQTLIIDKMWHMFILHTIDYQKFCMNYFNKFIHHVPNTMNKNTALIEKTPTKNEGYSKFDRSLKFIYDNLGEQTLIKWYKVYPKKYSRKKILAVTR